MKLQFKATEKYKYHNDGEVGVVRDGDVVDVGDAVGKKLLRDYPNNFFKTKKNAVEGAKNKMLDNRSDTAVKDIEQQAEGTGDAVVEDVEVVADADPKKAKPRRANARRR